MKYARYASGFIAILMMSLGVISCNNTSSTTTLPGQWDALVADFGGIPRSGASSFILNGAGYVVGGFNYDAVGQISTPNGRLRDMWKFDPTSQTWAKVNAPFPGTARSNAVAFSLNNKAYYGTGYDGNVALSDFWEYDPTVGTNGTWTQLADFADGQNSSDSTRYGCLAFVVKNRAFLVGGHYLSDFNDWWEFTPPNTWTYIGSAGKKRSNAFVMIINDVAYIGGGTDNGQYVYDFIKFEVDKVENGNPWTAMNGLTGKDVNGNAITQPRPRELTSTFSIGNYGYITCGSTNGPLSDTWQYDPSKDLWTQYYSFSTNTPTAGSARSGACSFSFGDGYGYLTTGGSGNVKFDDTWRFNPTGTEPDNK